jgi:branched-chain amino acid transport system substrate-binding protein
VSILSPTMRLWWKLSASILIGALLLSACPRDEKRGAATDAIRIGILYPLSGPDAITGEDLRAGLNLALEIINESHELAPLPLAEETGLPGRAGRKIELVFRDTQGDPIRASKGLEELVTREEVVAVIGCYRSNVTALASEQAEMERIPFLNAESTSPVLIQRGLRWFFRTTPDDRMFSGYFFEFLNAMRDRGLLSRSCPLALVYEDGLWGTNVAQALQRLAWQHEYNVAADVPYDATAEAFQQELKKIERVMPGVVLHASYVRDALAFMRGYRSLRLQPFAILAMNAGFVSPEFIPALGPDAEHVMSREVWAVDLAEKKPLIKQVNDLFRLRYHRDMTGLSARSFTGLMVLAEALDRADGLRPEAVRKALLQTDLRSDQLIMPWDGIRFDPGTGQNTLGKGIIVQVQQGRYVTVWPDSMAASQPIWPAASGCKQE